MSKTMYMVLGAVPTPTHRGDNTAKLNGTASFWQPFILSESRGGGASGSNATVATVTGPTNGLEVSAGVLPAEWLSAPLSADFTISGTITINLWAFETAMTDNAAINVVIDKVSATTGAITQIVKTSNVVELATASAVNNFTATPTSTACNRGDLLRVRVFASDVGTMAAPGPVSFQYNRNAAGVSGDSFVTFTENLTFEPLTTPSGSTYYLTDTAETINPGSATEKKALTTRGSGSVNAVTNTATGPTAGIQVTATAGGTAVEWYTPALNAFTLGGVAKFNIRALESNVAANASLKAEVAITATDGTGATVWGLACIEAVSGAGGSGEITASDVAYAAWVAGGDTAVTSGQRLRFRIFVEDCATTALVSGQTVTITYSGTSAAAAGDTYVILPQSVTEYVQPARRHLQSNQVAIMRPALR